jgi:hypothetical protein
MKFVMSQNCNICIPLTEVRNIEVGNNRIVVHTKDDKCYTYGEFRRKETATAALVGLMNDLEYEAWARVVPDKEE